MRLRSHIKDLIMYQPATQTTNQVLTNNYDNSSHINLPTVAVDAVICSDNNGVRVMAGAAATAE